VFGWCRSKRVRERERERERGVEWSGVEWSGEALYQEIHVVSRSIEWTNMNNRVRHFYSIIFLIY
jgi:hypothetical protein